MLVSKRNYGEYSGDNYGAHTQRITIGTLMLWFSYDTVVAFSDGDGVKVRQNDWSSTTGKHLNWIDEGNKKSRLPSEEFEKLLSAALARHDLGVS